MQDDYETDKFPSEFELDDEEKIDTGLLLTLKTMGGKFDSRTPPRKTQTHVMNVIYGRRIWVYIFLKEM